VVSKVAFDLDADRTAKSPKMLAEKINPKSEATLGIHSQEVVFHDKTELKDIPMKPPAVVKSALLRK
tara:strand:+ start:1047 stop:1247 length:201 start_codon:yes stop_codon:yes gene_type:complete